MIRDRSSAHPFVGLPPLHAKREKKKCTGSESDQVHYCALPFAAGLGLDQGTASLVCLTFLQRPVPASVYRLGTAVEFSTICLPVRPANSAPACHCVTTVRPLEVLDYLRKGKERERRGLSRAVLCAGRRERYTVAINKGLE